MANKTAMYMMQHGSQDTTIAPRMFRIQQPIHNTQEYCSCNDKDFLFFSLYSKFSDVECILV